MGLSATQRRWQRSGSPQLGVAQVLADGCFLARSEVSGKKGSRDTTTGSLDQLAGPFRSSTSANALMTEIIRRALVGGGRCSGRGPPAGVGPECNLGDRQRGRKLHPQAVLLLWVCRSFRFRKVYPPKRTVRDGVRQGAFPLLARCPSRVASSGLLVCQPT